MTRRLKLIGTIVVIAVLLPVRAQMTKVAWKKKRKEIEKLQPGITQVQFVFNLSRRQNEKEFGRDYARPKGFARVVGFLYHLIPKIGPFKVLAFKVPTPEAEKLFLESFGTTRERFAQLLSVARAGDVNLANTNLDTGAPTPRGEYELADETYDRLLEKLTERQFAGVSDVLRADLRGHFGENHPKLARE